MAIRSPADLIYDAGAKLGADPSRLGYRPIASTVRNLRHRAEETLRTIRPPGVAGRIRKVTLEVNLTCNLRCSFCMSHGDKGVAKRLIQLKDPLFTDTLSDGELFRVMDQFSAHRPWVYLSGPGEPTLRKSFGSIVTHLGDLGLPTGFTTNATLWTPILVQQVLDAGTVEYIVVSIDGTEETHDAIRGSGNYARSIRTVQSLRTSRKDGRRPVLRMNCVVTPAIRGKMGEIVAAAKENGFDEMTFQNLWWTTEALAESHRLDLQTRFGVDDRGAFSHAMEPFGAEFGREIVEEFWRTRRTAPIPITLSPTMSPEEGANYYSRAEWGRAKSCPRPWDGLIVKTNGDVIFCPDHWATEYRLGSLRTQSLQAIWSGPRAVRFRESIATDGLFAVCQRCCVVNGELKVTG